MVDSALWLCASPLYVQKMETKVEGQKEYYETQIVLLNQKIEVAQNDIKGIQKRAEAIEQKAYVDGVMDIAKADKFLAELNQKIEAKQKEITTFQNRIRDFESLLFQYKGEYEGEYMEDVNGITDDSVRYDIIHQMIKWASISKYENNKMLTEINIYDYLDNKHSYLLDSRNHKIYTEYTPEGKGIVEAEGAFIQRFTSTYQAPDRREEYLAYQKQYREARKNDEATKAANAERQRRFRERKKAESNND